MIGQGIRVSLYIGQAIMTTANHDYMYIITKTSSYKENDLDENPWVGQNTLKKFYCVFPPFWRVLNRKEAKGKCGSFFAKSIYLFINKTINLYTYQFIYLGQEARRPSPPCPRRRRRRLGPQGRGWRAAPSCRRLDSLSRHCHRRRSTGQAVWPRPPRIVWPPFCWLLAPAKRYCEHYHNKFTWFSLVLLLAH